MAKDYYFLLGIRQDASDRQIKSAYRRRARELHPDYTGGESTPFQDLQEAYAVLSNRHRRAKYDRDRSRRQTQPPRFRPEPLRSNRYQGPEPLRSEFVPPRDIWLTESFETYEPSLDDLFGRIWSNYEILDRPKSEHVEALTVEIPVTPEQAMWGDSIRLQFPALVACTACHGHGSVGLFECWTCAGRGRLITERPVYLKIPPGLRHDTVVPIPLDEVGIHNLYLNVILRVSAGMV